VSGEQASAAGGWVWAHVVYWTGYSYDQKVEHYRVRRNDAGEVTVDDEEFFENLLKLVEVRFRWELFGTILHNLL